MNARRATATRAGGLGLAAALLVSACTGGGATTAPSASTSAAPATSAAAPSESAGSPGASSEQIGGSVSLLGPWGGQEEEPLKAVLKPFEERTGITVNYTGSRDLANLLRVGVDSGTAPDVADLPSPGILQGFAKEQALIPLDDIIDKATYEEQVAEGPRSIGVVDGKIYGIFFLGSIKGLIWYDPKVYTSGVPTSWDDLEAKGSAAAQAAGTDTKPWCVAIANDAATGWPATDWIEDFLIRQAGPDKYDQWVNGTLKWSSPEVKAAFQGYGSVVAPDQVFGGPDAVITTSFDNGGNGLFTQPPGCIFHHQASFATTFFQSNGGAKPGDYDFFPFPDIDPAYAGSVVGAGDYMAMFKDTPQSRALISYLATAEAQSIWTGLGGLLSGNKTITNYPDDTQKRSGEVLANAKAFRFDGSDLMPQPMLQAFWTGVLDYTRDQSKLDSVLADLDAAQASAYGG
jgi:alpha-glucoside transport system substrate-binding protein